jgi:hypothetical protein
MSFRTTPALVKGAPLHAAQPRSILKSGARMIAGSELANLHRQQVLELDARAHPKNEDPETSSDDEIENEPDPVFTIADPPAGFSGGGGGGPDEDAAVAASEPKSVPVDEQPKAPGKHVRFAPDDNNIGASDPPDDRNREEVAENVKAARADLVLEAVKPHLLGIGDLARIVTGYLDPGYEPLVRVEGAADAGRATGRAGMDAAAMCSECVYGMCEIPVKATALGAGIAASYWPPFLVAYICMGPSPATWIPFGCLFAVPYTGCGICCVEIFK